MLRAITNFILLKILLINRIFFINNSRKMSQEVPFSEVPLDKVPFIKGLQVFDCSNCPHLAKTLQIKGLLEINYKDFYHKERILLVILDVTDIQKEKQNLITNKLENLLKEEKDVRKWQMSNLVCQDEHDENNYKYCFTFAGSESEDKKKALFKLLERQCQEFLEKKLCVKFNVQY